MREFQSWRMLNSTFVWPVWRLLILSNVSWRGYFSKKLPIHANSSKTSANVLQIRNWRALLLSCWADTVCPFTRRQHFTAWNYVMAAILKLWRHINNLTPYVDAYLDGGYSCQIWNSIPIRFETTAAPLCISSARAVHGSHSVTFTTYFAVAKKQAMVCWCRRQASFFSDSSLPNPNPVDLSHHSSRSILEFDNRGLNSHTVCILLMPAVCSRLSAFFRAGSIVPRASM